MEQIRQEAREREIAKREQASVAEEEDDEVSSDTEADDSVSGQENPSDSRRTIAPEEDLDLDDSLTGSCLLYTSDAADD